MKVSTEKILAAYVYLNHKIAYKIQVMKKNKKSFSLAFEKFSNAVTRATGSSWAFLIALVIIVVWALTGPIFGFSDTWQLVINTGTTIITFLMVFIIQQSQNKDTVAIQLKLNELIACNYKASNRLIDVEDLTEEELQVIKKFYVQLAKLAKKDANISATHSLDEAAGMHEEKKKQTTSKKS
jgi:low affinity Fe/Cu permease